MNFVVTQHSNFQEPTLRVNLYKCKTTYVQEYSP